MVYDITINTEDGYLHVIVKGTASLDGNIDLQMKVVKACTKEKLNRAIVDIRDLKNPTSITEVYQFGKESERNLRNILIKAAVLHNIDRTEHESFLETTMRNRGVNLKSFVKKKDALEWLLE